ncbi:MAG: FHIPEP family type III secretion protein, partial [Oligoflexia bacterium]|nr:FHIPEP family type III secretion protein [Oligoflexia bacterium]
PDILPLGTVLKVLQTLLKEGVSIRDLRTILESLAENGPTTKSKNVDIYYRNKNPFKHWKNCT